MRAITTRKTSHWTRNLAKIYSLMDRYGRHVVVLLRHFHTRVTDPMRKKKLFSSSGQSYLSASIILFIVKSILYVHIYVYKEYSIINTFTITPFVLHRLHMHVSEIFHLEKHQFTVLLLFFRHSSSFYGTTTDGWWMRVTVTVGSEYSTGTIAPLSTWWDRRSGQIDWRRIKMELRYVKCSVITSMDYLRDIYVGCTGDVYDRLNVRQRWETT